MEQRHAVRHPSLHTPILAVAIVAGGLALALVAGRAEMSAQKATPEVVLSGDITAEETAFGIADALPLAPASIDLYRIELPPGASISDPATTTNPGLGAHVIESGTVTLRVVSGDVTVTRAGNQATPGALDRELVAAGTEVQLGPGDGFIQMPYAASDLRNDGTEPAVFLGILIFPQDGTMAATPAP